jgi:hypothetical protein
MDGESAHMKYEFKVPSTCLHNVPIDGPCAQCEDEIERDWATARPMPPAVNCGTFINWKSNCGVTNLKRPLKRRHGALCEGCNAIAARVEIILDQRDAPKQPEISILTRIVKFIVRLVQ